MAKVFGQFSTALFLAAIVLLWHGCKEPEPTLAESLAQASQLLSQGRADQAINLLEGLLQNHQKNTEVIENLAFAYVEEEDHSLAAFYFAQLAEKDTNQLHFLLYSAQSLNAGGDVRGAAHAYSRYLKDFPEAAPIWNTLGDRYHDLGEPERAAESYQASYRIQPKGETAWQVGTHLNLSGLYPQAGRWFEAALNHSDGFEPEGLLGLLGLAIRAQAFERAETLVARLDKDYPGRLDITELAPTRVQLRIWREQQIALAERLKEQERLAREIEERARLAAQAEAARLAAAAQAAAEGKAPEEGLPRELQLLGKARGLKDQGHLSEATDLYQQALALDDRDPSVWQEFSELLLADNQVRWAEVSALEAMRRDPQNADFALTYLRAARLRMDPHLFVRELSRTRDRFPYSPELTLKLARAQRDVLKSPRNASILYREFLRLAPNHPERILIEQELDQLGLGNRPARF